MNGLTPQDRDAIEEIVEQTVERTLLKLGIDVSTPAQIEAFRDDQRHLRDWRIAMGEVRKAGLLASIGTIVTGLIAIVVMGAQQMMRGGGG